MHSYIENTLISIWREALFFTDNTSAGEVSTSDEESVAPARGHKRVNLEDYVVTREARTVTAEEPSKLDFICDMVKKIHIRVTTTEVS